MAYTPDPDDATNPVLATLAGTAQAEFVALKTKLNLLFNASSMNADTNVLGINSGLSYIKDIPAGTSTQIAYGFATDITRNDAASPIPAVAAQLNARLGAGINPTGAVDITIFGFASEAWTHETLSQATLKGGEVAVIAQANNNIMQLRGLDVVFKNRSDIREVGGLGPAQGLGSNMYNANSAGITFSSNNRSALYGEYCGWGSGIRFNADCLDIWWDKAPATGIPRYFPAIGIDFSRMLDPVAAETNPWKAHRMTSAIAMKEYHSITWDGLQQVRSYLDSINSTHWYTATGGSPALNGNPGTAVVNGLGYQYAAAQLAITTAVGLVPGAATGSITILVNGAPKLIAIT